MTIKEQTENVVAANCPEALPILKVFQNKMVDEDLYKIIGEALMLAFAAGLGRAQNIVKDTFQPTTEELLKNGGKRA